LISGIFGASNFGMSIFGASARVLRLHETIAALFTVPHQLHW